MIKNNIQKIGVAIIGAGPAGLMAAEILSNNGISVDIFDAMPTAGRKFLMAGKSGLNISHNEAFDKLLSRYGNKQEALTPALEQYNASHIKKLMDDLEIESFVGSSGRIFPKNMKTAPLLRNWLKRLSVKGAKLHTRHKWTGWADDGALSFSHNDQTVKYAAQHTIMALGGGSWSRLGSDAAWVKILQKLDVSVNPLMPSNCGFNVGWSKHFIQSCEGSPVTNIILSHQGKAIKGSFMISHHGIEGGAVYTLSSSIRDDVHENGSSVIEVDLTPDRSVEELTKALSRSRGRNSLSNHIRKTIGIKGAKAQLLRECSNIQTMNNPKDIAKAIKATPIIITSPRPIDEAISTAGGISFDEMDENFMLSKMNNVYCVGEMMDWEAPTGGYLITACMATGHHAGLAIVNKIKNVSET